MRHDETRDWEGGTNGGSGEVQGEERRDLSKIVEVRDEVWEGGGGRGREGEQGLSLLWLSVLPPDRPDRACNQTHNTDSQTAGHINCSIYTMHTI